MSKAQLQSDIRKLEGLIFSEGTLDTKYLLCRAYDFLKHYKIHDRGLKKKIAKCVGLPPDCFTATHAYYYNQLNPKKYNQEVADELWEEACYLLDSLSPAGYSFGSHEGDGSCIGWFKYEDEC